MRYSPSPTLSNFLFRRYENASRSVRIAYMAISMTVFDDAQKNYELRGENGVEAIYCTHIAKPGQFILNCH